MFERLNVEILSKEEKPSPFANGMHNEYQVRLSYNNVEYEFTMHDSVHAYENGLELDPKHAVWSVLMDSNSYEYNNKIEDFLTEFGYDEFDIYESTKIYRKSTLYDIYSKEDVDTVYQGIEAFKACKKANKILHEMMTDEELAELEKEFEDF